MKKTFVYTLLICVIILLGIIGYKNSKTLQASDIYISLRHSTTDNIHYLEWIVENRSNTDSVVFKEGSILNYKISHTSSGKTYTSGLGDITSDVTLAPGEIYNTEIELKDMPLGHYRAKFWAEWEDNKKGAMTISFDIKE